MPSDREIEIHDLGGDCVVQRMRDQAELIRKMDALSNPPQTHEATTRLLEKGARIIELYKALHAKR